MYNKLDTGTMNTHKQHKSPTAHQLDSWVLSPPTPPSPSRTKSTKELAHAYEHMHCISGHCHEINVLKYIIMYYRYSTYIRNIIIGCTPEVPVYVRLYVLYCIHMYVHTHGWLHLWGYVRAFWRTYIHTYGSWGLLWRPWQLAQCICTTHYPLYW